MARRGRDPSGETLQIATEPGEPALSPIKRPKHVYENMDGSACRIRLDRPGRARGGRLTSAERQGLPKSDFALPGKGEGPKGAGSGSYPIPDQGHARAALSRVAQHGSPAEKAAVRSKVHRKFPGIAEKGD